MADSMEGSGGGLRFVLVRAAETDFSLRGRMEGDVDVPLTPHGRMRARRLVDETLLPLGGLVAVYTGRNQGSRETAEILAAANSNRIRVVGELDGVSFGLWEGQLVADVRQRHARIWESWMRDPLGITPPEGEDMGSAYARVGVAVKAIRRRHREGNVAVVGPEAVISLAYCHLTGRPAGDVFVVGRGLGRVEVVPGASGQIGG